MLHLEAISEEQKFEMNYLSKNQIKKSLALFIAVIVCSCNPMKKDADKDRADDIKEVVVSKNESGVFLVIKEEIFQALSKSDQGGFRRITGYTEDRISSYDINTGALVKRIVLGEREKNECFFLGETNGKLWYKSVDEELGVHARDPGTLSVTVTQKQITEANPFFKDNLSKPEWNTVQRYYGFDVIRMQPMVSDNAGFVYYIDPVSLKADKTSESLKKFDTDNSCTSTSMNTDVSTNLYLQGNPRNSITYSGKEFRDPSFLDGNFLKSSNMVSPDAAGSKFLVPVREKIDMYNNEIDSLKSILEKSDTTSSNLHQKISKKHSYSSAQRKIENLRMKIDHAESDLRRQVENRFFEIVTDDNCVFIMSRSDVSDKAKVVISKICLNKDTSPSLAWQTQLDNVYREPDKGFDKSSFEFVFSKGNPDLSTMRTLYDSNKLVFIFMLTATCIDTDSGRILWSRDL